jgi:hypothetical protein
MFGSPVGSSFISITAMFTRDRLVSSNLLGLPRTDRERLGKFFPFDADSAHVEDGAAGGGNRAHHDDQPGSQQYSRRRRSHLYAVHARARVLLRLLRVPLIPAPAAAARPSDCDADQLFAQPAAGNGGEERR